MDHAPGYVFELMAKGGVQIDDGATLDAGAQQE